jgi:hypothetical protein
VHSATGSPTDFAVSAAVPAKLFGGLTSGKSIAFNVNADSIQRGSDGGKQDSTMWAFFIPRGCHEPGDASASFGCGTFGYNPNNWARLSLQ